MTPLELTGLKGNHPLGFLSACGVLRCCGVEGQREATLRWKEADDGSGWFAVLGGIEDLSSDSLIEILIRRAERQSGCKALCWSDKIDDRAEFKRLGSDLIDSAPASVVAESTEWLPALSSDIVGNTGKLQRTSLDLTSGKQLFLKSLREVAAELSRKATKKQLPVVGSGAFQEALYGPWLYKDKTHSLGWDPQTQRLHALRNKIPEKDKQRRSVRGAVFLASQALPLFPSFSVRGKLRTTGFQRLDGDDWFAWPIWCEPVSISTLRSLLTQPLDSSWKRRGVNVAYRCPRAHTGGSDSNYRVFGNAEEFLLP